MTQVGPWQTLALGAAIALSGCGGPDRSEGAASEHQRSSYGEGEVTTATTGIPLRTLPLCGLSAFPLRRPGFVVLPYAPRSAPTLDVDFALPTWLSILAYKSRSQIVSQLRDIGFRSENIVMLEDAVGAGAVLPGTIQGFMAQGARGRFVVFRGTSDPLDWIVNLDFTLDSRAGNLVARGGAHSGFYAGALAATGLVKSMQAYRGPGSDLPVWIVGHSLGGAYASLFGLLAASEGLPVGAVVTIGQPRAANRALAALMTERLHGRLFRLVKADDIFPHFPPTPSAATRATSFLTRVNSVAGDRVREELKAAGFAHAGQELVLDGGTLRATHNLTDADDEHAFEQLQRLVGPGVGAGTQPLRQWTGIAERILSHRPEPFFCALAKGLLKVIQRYTNVKLNPATTTRQVSMIRRP